MDVNPLEEELTNDLARWLAAKVDKPLAIDGWFTAGRMADEAHCSYDRANHVLNQGIASGEIELRQYGNIKYYRLVRAER
jgi:hypothetical protein